MSDHNKMLIDRIKGMPAQPGDLSEEIGWLLEEIDEQKDELDRLRAENQKQAAEVVWQSMELDRLQAEVSEWKMKYESEVTLVDNVEAELDRLREEVSSLHERLEDSYYFDEHGNRVECEPGWPDGISCRDETIKLQDAELDRLREALMEIKKLNEMSGFNGCAIAEVYSKYLPDLPKETEG